MHPTIGGTVRALSDDPFAMLGVPADASPGEISAARRRLAQFAHPDHGGDVNAMQALNAAYEAALLRRPVVEPVVEPAVEQVVEQVVEQARTPSSTTTPASTQRSTQRVQRDSPSFVIDVAPAQAHEALLVVAASIGEVIVDAPPYMIECLLDEPIRCWCRLDVAPEGEGSSVSLIVERYEDVAAPDIDAVRDEWVSNLNRNERPL